jgi:hypothetical protein
LLYYRDFCPDDRRAGYRYRFRDTQYYRHGCGGHNQRVADHNTAGDCDRTTDHIIGGIQR